MTKHTYPGNFLRKRYYKVIRDFNLLGHCYLARYSDNNYPYINFEDFKQKLKYHFGASQIMTGISTNLLGRLKKYITEKAKSPGKHVEKCKRMDRGQSVFGN